jgi:hypothetical protein
MIISSTNSDGQPYKIQELMERAGIYVDLGRIMDLMRLCEGQDQALLLGGLQLETEEKLRHELSKAEDRAGDIASEYQYQWRELVHFESGIMDEPLTEVDREQWADALQAWFKKKVFREVDRGELTIGPKDFGAWDRDD